jgi:hypothetical protein
LANPSKATPFYTDALVGLAFRLSGQQITIPLDSIVPGQPACRVHTLQLRNSSCHITTLMLASNGQVHRSALGLCVLQRSHLGSPLTQRSFRKYPCPTTPLHLCPHKKSFGKRYDLVRYIKTAHTRSQEHGT